MEASLNREQALEFLEGMERRHNEVLDSLDELNQRIESVLQSQGLKPTAATKHEG